MLLPSPSCTCTAGPASGFNFGAAIEHQQATGSQAASNSTPSQHPSPTSSLQSDSAAGFMNPSSSPSPGAFGSSAPSNTSSPFNFTGGFGSTPTNASSFGQTGAQGGFGAAASAVFGQASGSPQPATQAPSGPFASFGTGFGQSAGTSAPQSAAVPVFSRLSFPASSAATSASPPAATSAVNSLTFGSSFQAAASSAAAGSTSAAAAAAPSGFSFGFGSQGASSANSSQNDTGPQAASQPSQQGGLNPFSGPKPAPLFGLGLPPSKANGAADAGQPSAVSPAISSIMPAGGIQTASFGAASSAAAASFPTALAPSLASSLEKPKFAFGLNPGMSAAASASDHTQGYAPATSGPVLSGLKWGSFPASLSSSGPKFAFGQSTSSLGFGSQQAASNPQSVSPVFGSSISGSEASPAASPFSLGASSKRKSASPEKSPAPVFGFAVPPASSSVLEGGFSGASGVISGPSAKHSTTNPINQPVSSSSSSGALFGGVSSTPVGGPFGKPANGTSGQPIIGAAPIQGVSTGHAFGFGGTDKSQAPQHLQPASGSSPSSSNPFGFGSALAPQYEQPASGPSPSSSNVFGFGSASGGSSSQTGTPSSSFQKTVFGFGQSQAQQPSTPEATAMPSAMPPSSPAQGLGSAFGFGPGSGNKVSAEQGNPGSGKAMASGNPFGFGVSGSRAQASSQLSNSAAPALAFGQTDEQGQQGSNLRPRSPGPFGSKSPMLTGRQPQTGLYPQPGSESQQAGLTTVFRSGSPSPSAPGGQAVPLWGQAAAAAIPGAALSGNSRQQTHEEQYDAFEEDAEDADALFDDEAARREALASMPAFRGGARPASPPPEVQVRTFFSSRRSTACCNARQLEQVAFWAGTRMCLESWHLIACKL